MKIEFEIDEAKILELAKATSPDDLPRNIYYEAKREAVEIATREIKAKLAEKSYYSDKETLYKEVSDYLYAQISGVIKTQIETKFKEGNIESLVSGYVNKQLNEWVKDKVNTRLEEIKADLQFYSQSELDEDQKQRREEDYNNR